VRAENLSITQGAALPTPTVTYEGFVGADSADNTLSTKATARLSVSDSATVGTSDIGFTTEAVLNDTNGANYTLVHTTGTLTITAPSENSETDNKGTTDNMTNTSALPKTGDSESFSLLMLSLMLLAAGLGVAGASMTGRLSRRHHSRNRH
jgi:LPXTG-motif cell wall-anchored protein